MMFGTPKTQAFAFAATLLIASTALVGTSIATTGSVLRPFALGEDYAQERPMTRGQHAALGLRVGQQVGDEIRPIAGATVVVARLGAPEATDSIVATKETNDRGRVIFDLRPGAYQIGVTHGSLMAEHRIRLGQSLRLDLVFDAEGTPHWREAPHREMERRGELVDLLVRVFQNESGSPAPVANATVQVYRYQDRNTTVYVGEMKTGPRGAALFHLHRGAYLIKVIVGDVTGEKSLRIQEDVVAHALLDGDTVHWRAGHPQGSPSRSPSPTSRP